MINAKNLHSFGSLWGKNKELGCIGTTDKYAAFLLFLENPDEISVTEGYPVWEIIDMMEGAEKVFELSVSDLCFDEKEIYWKSYKMDRKYFDRFYLWLFQNTKINLADLDVFVTDKMFVFQTARITYAVAGLNG